MPIHFNQSPAYEFKVYLLVKVFDEWVIASPSALVGTLLVLYADKGVMLLTGVSMIAYEDPEVKEITAEAIRLITQDAPP